MTRRREQARLISEYVDARIGRIAGADTNEPGPEEHDFDGLLDLARELSQLEVVPPRAAEDAVLQRVCRDAAGLQMSVTPTLESRVRQACSRVAHAALPSPLLFRPAIAAAVVVAVVSGVLWLRQVQSPLSASDFLARVDRPESVVSSGEVLHRVFLSRTVGMETGAPGGEIVIDEWVDGGGIRAAAEGHSPTGQLLWVVLNDLDGDESRFRMYLPPNGADNPRGTLIVRPTAREFSDAMAQFPERERSALSSYLSRRRLVYEPVWSDRLQNRTLLRLESRGGHTVGTLGLAPWTTPDGKPGYRLSEIDPTYPWLERRGAMLVGKPARLERVRYVEGGSYLTLRETTDYRLADGGGFSGERIIVSTRRTPRTVETDARFELRIPAGTPVFRAGALEELRAIAAALTK